MAVADGLAQPRVVRDFAAGDEQSSPRDVIHVDERDADPRQGEPDQVSRRALGQEALRGLPHRADHEWLIERRSHHRRQGESHAVQAVIGDTEAPYQHQRPQDADAAAAVHPHRGQQSF
jgi:hypothetical protein